MEDQANALVQAVDRHLPAWVVACIRRRTDDPDVLRSAPAVAEVARREVVDELRRLLALDVDRQHSTPLSVLRRAVRHPTRVLREAGVPPVERDDFARDRFPDDLYDLTPATFADVHPDVGDAGIAWGAAKVVAHRRRHGSGTS